MTQPEALRFADMLEAKIFLTEKDLIETTAELRRLHDANQELLESLGLILASNDWPEIERIARAAIAKGEQA